jgi:hypothetical protein
LGSCNSGIRHIFGGKWISIFNGKNLEGWIPKVTGDSDGVNTLNVFRVEDGLLRICYDQYPKLDGRYDHLIVATSPFRLKDNRLISGKLN